MAETTEIVLSVQQGKDIIQVAIDQDVHDGAIPASDADILDLAGQIVWQAEAGEKNGIEHDAIPIIMKIARDRSYFDPGQHGNATAEEATAAMQERAKTATNGAEPTPAAVAQEEDAEFDEQVEDVVKAMRRGWTVQAPEHIFKAAAKIFEQEEKERQAAAEPGEGELRGEGEDQEIYHDGEWHPAPVAPVEEESPLPSQDEADAKTAENMANARAARQQAREAAQAAEAPSIMSAYCRRGQHPKCGGSARVSGVTHSCTCECHAVKDEMAELTQLTAEEQEAKQALIAAAARAQGVKDAPLDSVSTETTEEPSTGTVTGTAPPTVKLKAGVILSKDGSDVNTAVNEIRAEGLPLPPDVSDDEEPPTLPRDISKLSAPDLRSLHARYHVVLSSVIWLLSVAEADRESVKSMYDDRVSEVMLSLEALEEKRSVTSIKAEAQSDDKAKLHKQRLGKIQAKVTLYKGLKEFYSETVARISREMSFREMELQSASTRR